MVQTQFLAGVQTANVARARIPERSPGTGESELEHLTVGREVLIGQLLRDLACAGEPGAARLHLLVGPAGIGKTHVLDRVEAHIRHSPDIERRAIVAALPEQNCPTSVVQLLARLLRALPDDPELGPSVEALRSLQRQRDGDRERRALELIRLRLRGRRLFILLDRLDAILDVLGTEGWARLQSILNTETDWTLVTSARDGDLAPAGFRVHILDPLEPEQCAELLAGLARARPELAAGLASDKGRAWVRAIHHLLGGTPGAMTRVFRVLEPEHLARIERTLAKLGAVLEPELRTRTTRLSPSQRGLVDILVDSWRPLTVTEIAERAFAKQASTSGALRHLRREGLVRALEIGRERYYELCDPLHRLARPGQSAGIFAGVVQRWYARHASPDTPSARPAHTAVPKPSPEALGEIERVELDQRERSEALAILAQSPAIAVGRLRGRLARAKPPVMIAALILGLERGAREREALEALVAIPPAQTHATHLELARLSAALDCERTQRSTSARMVERILGAHDQPQNPERRRALIEALDEASPKLRQLLSDQILRYPMVQAWTALEAYTDLGQLLAALRPSRTRPSLESELDAAIESAWHSRQLAQLLSPAASFDGLLAIGSPRLRASLAWAGALASLEAKPAVELDDDELVNELRRRMGLEPDAPTWPQASRVEALGPTSRAMLLELLADPRSFALWSAGENREDFMGLAQTLLATGIYAWIASRRPLADLAELAARLREHSRVEVLPPALLASKTTREAHARLAVSERALVREILALREPPTPADASRESQFTATDLQLL